MAAVFLVVQAFHPVASYMIRMSADASNVGGTRPTLAVPATAMTQASCSSRSRRASSAASATDSAARPGGDEFVVLLAPVAEGEWAGDPRTSLTGLNVAVGISIGVALPNGRTQAEALVSVADEAKSAA